MNISNNICDCATCEGAGEVIWDIHYIVTVWSDSPLCKCRLGGYIIHKSKLGTALCSRNCAVLPVGFTKQMFLRSIIYIIGDWCNNFSPRLTWTTISSLMSRSDKEVDSPLLWRWHHQFYSDCPFWHLSLGCQSRCQFEQRRLDSDFWRLKIIIFRSVLLWMFIK